MNDPCFYYLHDVPLMAARVPCDQDLDRLIRAAHQILTAVHAAYRSKHVQERGLHGDGNSPLTAWCLYAGASRSSYSWVLRTAKELCNEYAFRYPLRLRHPMEQAFYAGVLTAAPEALVNAAPVTPPIYLVKEFGTDPVSSFARAYAFYVRGDATWTNRLPSVFRAFRQITPNAWTIQP